MKIVIVGCGYVGLSLATLLSQKYNVVAVDIIPEKVEMINKRISPIDDEYIKDFFKNKELKLKATTNYEEAIVDAKYIIICTPTNYDEKNHVFNTSSIENVVKEIKIINHEATVIIKSTIPVGFTNYIKSKYNMEKVIFSPEFLREGYALYDNLYPSRIIVGEKSQRANEFANLLKELSLKKDVKIKLMDSIEAETVKLFSNTYLAMRVAYFNELDTFVEIKGLNSKDIIEGIGLDERIGNHYNNPSFGYGGYCLPKDTKQLASSYIGIPNNLITSIVNSNVTRKEHIAKMVMKRKPKVVGIYRLIMKKNSDNFRESAIQDIIKILKKEDVNIIIYEPILKENIFNECKVINNFNDFCEKADIVLANRWESELAKIKDKVYTRDIYSKDL